MIELCYIHVCAVVLNFVSLQYTCITIVLKQIIGFNVILQLGQDNTWSTVIPQTVFQPQ